MDATKPCLLFYKKKENKDLPSLKSRKTESREEMYKSRQGIFLKINYLEPIYGLLNTYLLLDYNSNILLKKHNCLKIVKNERKITTTSTTVSNKSMKRDDTQQILTLLTFKT